MKSDSSYTKKSPKFKISPPSFSFSFGKSGKDQVLASSTKALNDDSIMDDPLMEEHSKYLRKKSFTPLVNIPDLLSSIKGDTYFIYDNDDYHSNLQYTTAPSLEALNSAINANKYSLGSMSFKTSPSSIVSSTSSLASATKKMVASLSISLPTYTKPFSSPASPKLPKSPQLTSSPNNVRDNSYKDSDEKIRSSSVSKSKPSQLPSSIIQLDSQFESPSQRILHDFDAILSSGDPQMIKAYMRNNNWPIDQPIRSEIWQKLCLKVGGKNVATANKFEDILVQYFPQLIGKANDQLTDQDFPVPAFIDTRFMSHYHLNNEGKGVFAHWLQWIYRDLPFEYLVKIMDSYLVQGSKVLYRIALAILILFKKEGKKLVYSSKPVATLTKSHHFSALDSQQNNQTTPRNISLFHPPIQKRIPEAETSTLKTSSSTATITHGGSTEVEDDDMIDKEIQGTDEANDTTVMVDPRNRESADMGYNKVSKKIHSHRHARHHKYSNLKKQHSSKSEENEEESLENPREDKGNKETELWKENDENPFPLKIFFNIFPSKGSGSVISHVTNNTDNWTANLNDNSNNICDIMSATSISHLRSGKRDKSQADATDFTSQSLRTDLHRRSTISPLDGYYEYPNIGAFISRFCQDPDFSPNKLLRIAFGIRGLRSHTIDELTMKYESFAKDRVSNLFLAAAAAEKGYSRNDDSARSIGSISYLPPPPYCGSEILDRDQFRYIWNWIPIRYTMYVPQKLFSTKQDGISLKTFFNKVDGEEPTLILIKTFDNEVFGAYCSYDWKGRNKTNFFGSGETFVFTISPQIYKYGWIGLAKNFENSINKDAAGTYMFQCATHDRIMIGGGGKGHALQFNNSLDKGTTQACQTFESPQLARTDIFDIKILEALAFK
ncbi:uncharacterized protein LOC135922347 isoform X2 [Gordionus sp. m RMFG-2023]|uniref:uncharacterized protein LOC135922347 isoform X2 n=1 Tax=Gordionus sp. m RMFG-2023 TaxID=3053472 RepID=UPI0031FDABFF